MNISWPQSLLDESIYPHPIEQLQLLETHISWVVLTGPYAYKIKKPVDLGFLNFSTLELRQHYCHRELELNRRFSSRLYLGVVAISGSLEQPCINADENVGDDPVLDYAVKMRQFDNHLLADNLAARGELSDTLIRRMALTLAHLHQQLPAVSDNVADTAIDAFYDAALQNFTQIQAYSLAEEMSSKLATLQSWISATYQRCNPLMQQRRQQGHIKDCHGDCHLGNIAIIDDEVTLFDCIEFNDSFRIMDTMAEAAFLTMDLCARQLPQQAQRFLNDYLEYCGDYDALPLFNLYRCHYAMVRAKVDLMKEAASTKPDISIDTHPDFYQHVKLATQFTVNTRPALILMHGLSGSGKSFVAERLAATVGAIRIRSDVERKRLFNLMPEQDGSREPKLYSEDATHSTFARLLQLAEIIINAGFTCIVDATFITRATREPFFNWANKEKLPLAIMHCQASENTILQRLQQRAGSGKDPSDADSAVYQRQKLIAEDFSKSEEQHVIAINTEREDCADFAVEKLRERT